MHTRIIAGRGRPLFFLTTKAIEYLWLSLLSCERRGQLYGKCVFVVVEYQLAQAVERLREDYVSIDRVTHAHDMVKERQTTEDQMCFALLLSGFPGQYDVDAVDATHKYAAVAQAENGPFVEQSVLQATCMTVRCDKVPAAVFTLLDRDAHEAVTRAGPYVMVVVLGESTDLGMGILVLQVHLVELLPVGLKDVQSGSVGNP